MLTLLIAVQQAVPRTQLGTATSFNQFARSIGGAVGVAVMGAVLSAGLASQLGELGRDGRAGLTPQLATELAAHPNALIQPEARVGMPAETLDALQGALASSVHQVFWTGTALAALSLLVSFWLPREGSGAAGDRPTEEACGVEACERLVVAELAALDPEHEPLGAKAE